MNVHAGQSGPRRRLVPTEESCLVRCHVGLLQAGRSPQVGLLHVFHVQKPDIIMSGFCTLQKPDLLSRASARGPSAEARHNSGFLDLCRASARGQCAEARLIPPLFGAKRGGGEISRASARASMCRSPTYLCRASAEVRIKSGFCRGQCAEARLAEARHNYVGLLHMVREISRACAPDSRDLCVCRLTGRPKISPKLAPLAPLLLVQEWRSAGAVRRERRRARACWESPVISRCLAGPIAAAHRALPCSVGQSQRCERKGLI
jgi:hypothetical protein